MAEILQTSVSVSFGDRDDDAAILWEVDNERSSPFSYEMYLRLYPDAPEVVFVTSGTLVSKGKDEADITDLVIFSGETEQSLQYPIANGVTLQRMGTSYDLDGKPIVVTYSYNKAKNSITASKPCYGIVEASYKAPYNLYLYTFTGTPCDLKYVDGAWIYTGGLTPAVAVAMNPSEGAVDTIQLTPEKCGSNGKKALSDDGKPVGIKLELHKEFHPRIIGSSTTDGIKMGCKVRQIPAVGADIDVSSGSYKQDHFVGSSTTADKDTNIHLTNNYEPHYTEVVKDLITFKTSSTARLKYQPAGSMSIKATGTFLDIWGNSVSPNFAEPGDEVLEVEWLNENTYTNPRSRTVQEDEIVAITSGNKTIPLYGAATVDYSIHFKVFDVTFQTTNALRPEDGWESIHMIAKYNGQTEYLYLPANSIKEK